MPETLEASFLWDCTFCLAKQISEQIRSAFTGVLKAENLVWTRLCHVAAVVACSKGKYSVLVALLDLFHTNLSSHTQFGEALSIQLVDAVCSSCWQGSQERLSLLWSYMQYLISKWGTTPNFYVTSNAEDYSTIKWRKQFFFCSDFLLCKASNRLLLRSASEFSCLLHMKPLETLNMSLCQ